MADRLGLSTWRAADLLNTLERRGWATRTRMHGRHAYRAWP